MLPVTKLESWPSLTTVVGPTTGRLGRLSSKVTVAGPAVDLPPDDCKKSDE